MKLDATFSKLVPFKEMTAPFMCSELFAFILFHNATADQMQKSVNDTFIGIRCAVAGKHSRSNNAVMN